MRALLAADPFLSVETRARIADEDEGAHDDLVSLGIDDCDAAELLDRRRAGCEFFQS